MKHTKIIGYTASIAIVLTISAFLFKGNDDAIVVNCQSAKKRTIEKIIPANGKISPEKSVVISPEVSGEISSISVEEGDAVNQGEILLTIRPDLYKSLVDKTEAALNSAKAQAGLQQTKMALAAKDLARSRKLYEDGNLSKESLEKAESEYLIAIAQASGADCEIKSAEASLNEAKENLSKTTISAPMSGIITRLNVKKGERVVGTSQMAGTELFVISDMNHLEMSAEINENDIPEINIGDYVKVNIDAFRDKEFEGYVKKIANSSKNIGINTEQVSTFDVRIAIDLPPYNNNSGLNVLPGMSASGSIVIERKNDVLSIPVGAVCSEQGREYVWIVENNGTVKPRNIRTGIRDLKYVEILTGIDTVDEFVSGPYSAIERLTEGVKIVKR